MKKDKIIYWVSTFFVIIFVGLGSLADLFRIEPIRESFKHIRFPEYMIPFFGVAKLLATLAILIPALKRLKEAAYAGLIYYFIGATYCHLAVGDGIDKFGVTAFILVTIIVSFVYSNKIKEI
jgi:hypothetical protein